VPTQTAAGTRAGTTMTRRHSAAGFTGNLKFVSVARSLTTRRRWPAGVRHWRRPRQSRRATSDGRRRRRFRARRVSGNRGGRRRHPYKMHSLCRLRPAVIKSLRVGLTNPSLASSRRYMSSSAPSIKDSTLHEKIRSKEEAKKKADVPLGMRKN
jgi:hypothetical protein